MLHKSRPSFARLYRNLLWNELLPLAQVMEHLLLGMRMQFSHVENNVLPDFVIFHGIYTQHTHTGAIGSASTFWHLRL